MSYEATSDRPTEESSAIHQARDGGKPGKRKARRIIDSPLATPAKKRHHHRSEVGVSSLSPQDDLTGDEPKTPKEKRTVSNEEITIGDIAAHPVNEVQEPNAVPSTAAASNERQLVTTAAMPDRDLGCLSWCCGRYFNL